MPKNQAQKRWAEIKNELIYLDNQKADLVKELMKIQKSCGHPNLPKRSLGEQYMDTCPDCGFLTYCYEI